MNTDFRPTVEPVADVDRLGDEIAELSAHLVYQDEDGMVVVHGRLDREAAAVLIHALAAARETLYRQTKNVYAETFPADVWSAPLE